MNQGMKDQKGKGRETYLTLESRMSRSTIMAGIDTEDDLTRDLNTS